MDWNMWIDLLYTKRNPIFLCYKGIKNRFKVPFLVYILCKIKRGRNNKNTNYITLIDLLLLKKEKTIIQFIYKTIKPKLGFIYYTHSKLQTVTILFENILPFYSFFCNFFIFYYSMSEKKK